MKSEMTFLPASFIVNEQPKTCGCGNNRALTAPDDDDVLPLPTINWNESPEPNYSGAAMPYPPGFDPRQRTEPTTPSDWRPPRPSDLFTQDSIDQPPTTGDAIERAFVANSRGLDDDVLSLPPTLAQILAQENREQEAEQKPEASFVLNAPEDDDAPLPLPYVVW